MWNTIRGHRVIFMIGLSLLLLHLYSCPAKSASCSFKCHPSKINYSKYSLCNRAESCFWTTSGTPGGITSIAWNDCEQPKQPENNTALPGRSKRLGPSFRLRHSKLWQVSLNRNSVWSAEKYIHKILVLQLKNFVMLQTYVVQQSELLTELVMLLTSLL